MRVFYDSSGSEISPHGFYLSSFAATVAVVAAVGLVVAPRAVALCVVAPCVVAAPVAAPSAFSLAVLRVREREREEEREGGGGGGRGGWMEGERAIFVSTRPTENFSDTTRLLAK